MSRLIHGEEARRTYSNLGLERACHMDGGFGVGVLAPGWDPMSSPIGVQSGDSFVPWRIPGCVAAYFSNSAVYGTVVHLTGGNVDTFYDLSGNGRHLLQAVAGSQPLWVASGSGGLLRFVSAGSDYMKAAAFTLNQPYSGVVWVKPTITTSGYVIDGNTNSSGTILTTAANRIGAYAGSFLAWTTETTRWMQLAWCFNGANSWYQIDQAAPVTGNAGAFNPGGCTLGASGGPSLYMDMDAAGVGLWNRAITTADVSRLYRWWLRNKAMMALT